ncbi:MAG: hypothetical protein KAR40_18430 [Candidatus Sabulitectum sp.]|nr:hypothetical protein [Candidatus Sabulitectum sp.]
MRLVSVIALTILVAVASGGTEVLMEISEKLTACFDQETGTFADGAHDTLLEAHSMIDTADLTGEQELAALKAMNSMVTYNLACLEALQGNSEEALIWLEESVASGYADSEWMLQDEDLSSISDDPEFAELAAAADENHVEHDCGSCHHREGCEDAE